MVNAPPARRPCQPVMANVMPLNTTEKWRAFALALTAIHAIVFFAVVLLPEPVLGLEKLHDTVVVVTIYLPLVPWHLIDAPLFEARISMLPTPNIIGYVVVVLSWAFFYSIVSYVLSAIVKRLRFK